MPEQEPQTRAEQQCNQNGTEIELGGWTKATVRVGDYARASKALSALAATGVVLHVEEDAIRARIANAGNTAAAEVAMDVVEQAGLSPGAFAVKPQELPLSAMMSDQTDEVTLRFDDGEREAKLIGGNLMGYIALDDPQLSQTWADAPDIDEWDGRAELTAADLKSAVGAVVGGSTGRVELTIGDETVVAKSTDHGSDKVHKWPVQAYTRGERVTGLYDEDTLSGLLSCVAPGAKVTVDIASSHSSILRIQSDGGLTFWVAGDFNSTEDSE